MKYVPRMSKHSNGKSKNQNKLRVIRNTQQIMSNYTISLVMADGKDQCSQVYYKNKPTKISPQIAWHFENTRCKWEIVCGIINRNQQGEHYIDYVIFGSKEECTINDLSELAFDVCKQMFEEAPKLHKLCPFYLARPNAEVNISLVLQTIHKYEVLNRIGTNFEFNCNLPFVDYHKDWINTLDKFKFNYVELEFNDNVG